ncbi:MAG: TlpA family protein disulfide reductase [Cyclobacteriaceae bacterium]|nr:TlpA family protein disulfide reductase [Cyclobacteriaceae bacterium]
MKNRNKLILFLLLFFLTENILAQQQVHYLLKSSGKRITKTQLDSLSAAHDNKLKFNFKKEGEQQIVEIELPGEDKSNDRTSFTREGNAASTQSSQLLGNRTYKDATGKIISNEEFKAKTKSGEFTARYELTKNESDTYDVTYFLVPKEDAKIKQSNELNDFTGKLINTKLPAFRYETLDGKHIDSNLLSGKILVLNFWFIGCKPCQEEIPLLNEVVQQYKDRADIVFVAPALDKAEPLTKFLARKTFSYQVAPNSNDLHKSLDLYAYPTHIIVDKNGIIRDVFIGATPDIKSKLTDAIEAAMKK